MDRMNFSKWEDEHWDTPGNPAYHPHVMNLGVVKYYINGIKSGREISRRVKSDLVYSYLRSIDRHILEH